MRYLDRLMSMAAQSKQTDRDRSLTVPCSYERGNLGHQSWPSSGRSRSCCGSDIWGRWVLDRSPCQSSHKGQRTSNDKAVTCRPYCCNSSVHESSVIAAASKYANLAFLIIVPDVIPARSSAIQSECTLIKQNAHRSIAPQTLPHDFVHLLNRDFV